MVVFIHGNRVLHVWQSRLRLDLCDRVGGDRGVPNKDRTILVVIAGRIRMIIERTLFQVLIRIDVLAT